MLGCRSNLAVRHPNGFWGALSLLNQLPPTTACSPMRGTKKNAGSLPPPSPSSFCLALSPGLASLDTQSSISELPRLLATPQASCDHARSRSHKREWLAPGQSCATPLTGEGSANACLRVDSMHCVGPQNKAHHLPTSLDTKLGSHTTSNRHTRLLIRWMHAVRCESCG